MLELSEVKDFLRVDGDDEDTLITSLIATARELTEEVLRRPLAEFEPVPETVKTAMLILIATLFEERQISKGKDGIDISETLDLVRRMLFAYRKERF